MGGPRSRAPVPMGLGGYSRTRFEAAVSRGLSTYVGREREMEVLERGLDKARSELCVIEIAAEPGMEKSRLLYEFCQRIGKERAFILSGSCSPDGQQTHSFPSLRRCAVHSGSVWVRRRKILHKKVMCSSGVLASSITGGRRCPSNPKRLPERDRNGQAAGGAQTQRHGHRDWLVGLTIYRDGSARLGGLRSALG